MKELKIINYPWHISHQYELMKIPNTKWSWLTQYKRRYGDAPRGDMISKYNIEYVPFYEKGKYDVALLHLDQQCFERLLWERGKGIVYKELNSVITDIPKIVIMHGTPYYPEQFKNDIFNDTYAKHGLSSKLIKIFHEVIGNNYVIFNSKIAYQQWEGDKLPRKAKTIWHGLDADEWLDLPKEPRVVTMISPAGLDKYYDRMFMTAIRDILIEKNIYHCHITSDAIFKTWNEYRTFLGRSLIYLNPTLESPMPRSRTEAMFSGCCVITTPWQDADQFIKDGVNGILINKRNPSMVAEIIEGLLQDYKTAIKIGQEGKKTAYETFSGDRYRKEWREHLEFIVNDYTK